MHLASSRAYCLMYHCCDFRFVWVNGWLLLWDPNGEALTLKSSLSSTTAAPQPLSYSYPTHYYHQSKSCRHAFDSAAPSPWDWLSYCGFPELKVHFHTIQTSCLLFHWLQSVQLVSTRVRLIWFRSLSGDLYSLISCYRDDPWARSAVSHPSCPWTCRGDRWRLHLSQ